MAIITSFDVEHVTQSRMNSIETNNDDVAVIILLYKNPEMKVARPFDLPICGKKMWEWVSAACSAYPIKTTICTPEHDVISLIKPMLTNKKYTVVLYSDTPLINPITINTAITYARAKNAKVLNLIRGAVYETEYIKTADSIHNSAIEEFDENAFFTIENLFDYEFINNEMRENILNLHIDNGVIIKDKFTTHIDADVRIEAGVILEPHNHIEGNTEIKSGCVIGPFNHIVDSVIGENSVVIHQYLSGQKLLPATILKP